MAKDLPETGEGGAVAPAPKPEPKDETAAIQRQIDAAAEKDEGGTVEIKDGVHFIAQALRLPANVKITGVSVATPAEHAKAIKGGVQNVTRVAVVGNQSESFELYHPQHAGAEALHGWKEHAHHEGAPILLTKSDYENALRAAAEPVTRVVAGFQPNTKQAAAGFKPGEKVDSHKAATFGVPVITDYEPHKPALSPHKGKGV